MGLARAAAIAARAWDEWAKNLLAIPRSGRRSRTENGNLSRLGNACVSGFQRFSQHPLAFPLRVAVSCIEKGGAGIHRSRDKREAFTTRRHAIKEPRRAPAESRKLFSKSTNADISCSVDPMFAE
jgi:hypothetical protein